MKAVLTKNGNSFSKHQRIITGGQKSSILGPLFFNILLTLIWGWGGERYLKNGKSCNPGILQHSVTFH